MQVSCSRLTTTKLLLRRRQRRFPEISFHAYTLPEGVRLRGTPSGHFVYVQRFPPRSNAPAITTFSSKTSISYVIIFIRSRKADHTPLVGDTRRRTGCGRLEFPAIHDS